MKTCPTCGLVSDGNYCPRCGASLDYYCPGCGNLVETADRLCDSCRRTVQRCSTSKANGPSIRVGAVVVDATGGHSTINIGAGAQQADPEQLLIRGQRLLKTAAYREAADVLEQAIATGAALPLAHVSLAVALLGKRNPAVCGRQIIRQVEACLGQAAQSETHRTLALTVLGVVKHDYYVVNGMAEGEPNLTEITRELQSQELSASDRQLLVHLKASQRAKKTLGIS